MNFFFFTGVLRGNKNNRKKVQWKNKVFDHASYRETYCHVFLMVTSQRILNFQPSSLYAVPQEIIKSSSLFIFDTKEISIYILKQRKFNNFNKRL